MSDLVLYNYFRSSTSYRARIALHHKALGFEYKCVHLLNNGGEQHAPEYKKISPLGEVPTLLHGGKVIAQSMAVIEYLDDVFPQNPLFPKDPWQRAKIRQICETVNCGIHPLQNLKVTQYLEKDLQTNADQRQTWLHHWTHKGLEGLEALVKQFGQGYAFGDQLTAADVFIVPQLFSARRFKISVEKYARLAELEVKCLKLEAFQKAHPHFQIDTPEDLKGKLS